MPSSLRHQQKLKNLKSQLIVAEEEYKSLSDLVKKKQQELALKLDLINTIKSEISKYENPSDIKITEHAVLRYLERVKGYDMETVKNEIVTEYLKDLINKMGGSGKYPNATDGTYKIVMKNNVIVTIED